MQTARRPAMKEAEISYAFEWSAAIATGRDDVDQDHQKIIDCLENLRNADAGADGHAVATLCLTQLSEHIVEHFALEEKIMDSFDYQDKDEHKHAHTQIAHEFRKFRVQAAEDPDIRQELLTFLYEWLVVHICDIDKVMIAQMNGVTIEKLWDQSAKHQTDMVIEGAWSIAAQVDGMSCRVSQTGLAGQGSLGEEGRRPPSHYRRIAVASERLLNLVALANTRVERYGCDARQLHRLLCLKSAIVRSAGALSTLAAQRVIGYCAHVLSGKYGMPVDAGAILAFHMDKIDGCVEIAGGINALQGPVRDAVTQAREMVRAVAAMGTTTMVLPDLKQPAMRPHGME
ncbi:MAG: hemerythrin family protein [Alphaproteobacteria bacterium]|nr:hemerythrin family protein [Alphaproteobacteria bacterium]